jgi:LysM domain
MADIHVVKKNDGLDSLWSISKHYGVSYQELKALNPEIMNRTAEGDSKHGWIDVGDKIKLPQPLQNENEHVCETKEKCELRILAVALQTPFKLCEPAMFKVTQYKGSPTDADKKNIKWMLRDAKTKVDLKSEQGTTVEEKGEKLILACVPFEWKDRTVEVAAQFDTAPDKKMTDAIPASAGIFEWIATIKKAESAYPSWSGVEITNAMRRLTINYDDDNFRRMYGGSPRGRELQAAGALTDADIQNLINWTRHTSPDTGIVTDPDGDLLAAGHVLTGISGGVYRNRSIDVTPLGSMHPAGERMDNLYAVTISGDLGQQAVFVNEGKKQKPYIGRHGDADEAEIIGDLDGFNIGFRQPPGGSGEKLSDILLSYYCPCKSEYNFRTRTSLFEQNDGGQLEDQVRRFANTYVYASEGIFDGASSFVTGEANEASAEFRTWAKNRKGLEAERVKAIENRKKLIAQ